MKMGKSLDYACSEHGENTPLLQSIKSDISEVPSIKDGDDSDKKTPFFKIVVAYVVSLFCVAGSCASVASVPILAGSIQEFELNAWRFAFQMLTPLPLIIHQRASLKIPRSVWHFTALYLLCYVTYNATYYTAAIYLPVGTMSGLSSTFIIIINAFLSVCIAKERKLHLYLAAAISSVGIIILVQPKPMFRNTSLHRNPPSNWSSPCLPQNTHHNPYSNVSVPLDGDTLQNTDKQWLGYVLLVISSVTVAIALRLVARIVHAANPFVLSLCTGMAATAISLIIMGVKETPTLPNNPLCFGLLIVHAFGTALYSTNFPYCMQYIPPTVFAFIRSLQLVVLLVLQYSALSDVLPGLGNWLEIFGAVLCFIGCTIGSLWQLVKEK